MPFLSNAVAEALAVAAENLKLKIGRMRFGAPVSYVYNPIEYAWEPYLQYLERYATGIKTTVFLGMNPGPFGMAQTGVPFGDVGSVRNWLKVCAPVQQPAKVHPKRPVAGFDCRRSEVSGRRLWGLFAARYGTPELFFKEHFVLNYCPLAFMEDTGRNRTPDKLAPAERDRLFAACDAHLREVIKALKPEWVVGIGGFAFARADAVFGGNGSVKLGQILHPSPACPASNRDWPGQVTKQLKALGIWE